MLQCWEIEPDKRPTFTSLVEQFSSSLETMANYMDMHSSTTKPLSTHNTTKEGEEDEGADPSEKEELDNDQQENSGVVNLIPESEVVVTIEGSKTEGDRYETSV